MSPAEQQLRALLATYETSLNAGDVGRIEQLYAEDGVFMPAGFPTASGRSAVRGAYDAVFSNIRIAIHFTVDELTVKGDVAYARTHSAGTATVVATGASGPETNRELFIFARGANGWSATAYRRRRRWPHSRRSKASSLWRGCRHALRRRWSICATWSGKGTLVRYSPPR